MGIIIFFLAFIALIAEFIVYMILGVSFSFAGGTESISGLAMFFVSTMTFTATVGILAPISAFTGHITKKRPLSYRILFIGTGIIMALVIVSLFLGAVLRNKQKTGKSVTVLEKKTKVQKIQEVSKQEVEIVVLDKGFKAGIYGDYITLKIEFKNITDKYIKGVKGAIKFYDIFGDKITNIGISYDKGIPAGETKLWKGVIDYNQFRDSDEKLRATDLENLKYDWEIEKIIYSEVKNQNNEIKTISNTSYHSYDTLMNGLIEKDMSFTDVEELMGIPLEKRKDSLGREIWIYPSAKTDFHNRIYFIYGRVFEWRNQPIDDKFE